MSPTFSPPTVVDLPTTVSSLDRTWSPLGNRLFRHYAPRGPVGQTVIKRSGTWSTVRYPTQAVLDAADTITDIHGQKVPAVFLGGHVYEVTASVATELTNAGYTVT